MPNDNTTNDLSNTNDTSKKGLLHSLNSLSFDDDDNNSKTSSILTSSNDKSSGSAPTSAPKNNNVPIPSNLNTNKAKDTSSSSLSNNKLPIPPAPNNFKSNNISTSSNINSGNKVISTNTNTNTNTNNNNVIANRSSNINNNNISNNKVQYDNNNKVTNDNSIINKSNSKDSAKDMSSESRFKINNSATNNYLKNNLQNKEDRKMVSSTISSRDKIIRDDDFSNRTNGSRQFSNLINRDSKNNSNNFTKRNITSETSSTLFDIENTFNSEMKKTMRTVKDVAKKIKDKSKFDLITNFGQDNTETIVINTFLNHEIPYTYKNGKTSNQRVHSFGVMTVYGVYTIRSSSAVTTKLEDALKYTHNNNRDNVGVLGEGSSRRIVLNLPPKEYGEDKVLDIPLITSEKDLKEHKFNGLDAISVDMNFIDELVSIAIDEVKSIMDYEEKRKATLEMLKTKSNNEVKKASRIADILSEFNI